MLFVYDGIFSGLVSRAWSICLALLPRLATNA